MDHFPEGLTLYDEHPLSPYYKEKEYRCVCCGLVVEGSYKLTRSGLCIDCIDDYDD